MDTSDTQAEAVKTDIITARDHLRAAAGLLKRLNDTEQGSTELADAEKKANETLDLIRRHGHAGRWVE